MFIFDGEGCCDMMGPVIPLSKFFVKPMGKIDCNQKIIPVWQNCAIVTNKISFFALSFGLPSDAPPWARVQHLFHEIGHCTGQPGIIVTPESYCPFPLNRHADMIAFIANALGSGQMLLLAAQYADQTGNTFQAVYGITSRGVEQMYLKQHAVPCFERMPRYLTWSKVLKELFGAEQSFSCAKKNLSSSVFLCDGVRIMPRLCSDFFLVTSVIDLAKLRHRYGEHLVVVLQVNDTWFVGYMRALLRQVACMRAWLARVDLVYVGYHDE